MTQSLLLRVVPDTIEQIGVSGSFIYPDARDLHRLSEYDDGASDWEVWFMYTDKTEDDPFTPKPGDTILGQWERYNGNRPAGSFHPDLFDYVRPIGNLLNDATSTFDGTENFAVYPNGMGAPSRWWGSENPAPDDNQDRHIVCERFVTEFAGQDYYRVRFILQPPFDKDNAPNALAILIYTDPQRQVYFYTPGAFIFDDERQHWYAETTIGQSPTGAPEPVHYCVALGSAPLAGGGTVPADSDHVSHNWDQDLPGGLANYAPEVAQQNFITRHQWKGYADRELPNEILEISRPEWGTRKITTPFARVIRGDYSIPQPGWMSDEDYLFLLATIEQAAGRAVMNAPPV